MTPQEGPPPFSSPNSYIVVPIPVWSTIAARDETDDE